MKFLDTIDSAKMIEEDSENRFVTDVEKEAWSGKQDNLGYGTTSQFLRGDKTWQTVTKSNVGLGSVSNYGLATQAEAYTGTSNVKYMTPLRVKESILNQIELNNLTLTIGTTQPTSGWWLKEI